MAEQQTSTQDTVVSNRAGLATDVNASYISKEQYTHARNAVRNSKDGDLGTIGNEQSNILCFNASYKIIGSIILPDDEVMVFSTNGTDNEIGIGSIKTCQYRIIMSSPCLNFNEKYPVVGAARKDFSRGLVVTFTDKYNPIRRIELKKLKSTTTCDDIRLFKLIDQPCIKVSKGQTGNMPDGMYSVVMAYVVDGKVFSDWYSITNRVSLGNGQNSLNVTINGLDKEFDQFAIAVVGNYIDPVTNRATKVAKQVGIYSTKVKNVAITDFINTSYPTIQLSDLVIHKTTWQKAGIISSNANYLIIGDLIARQEADYQLKAMSIEIEYTVEQAAANYYENDGEDISYYRDENYDFYIQGVYNTGELTDRYHIPGPVATSRDRENVSSSDVYEYDTDYSCATTDKIQRWQVENTAGEMIPEANQFVCGRRVVGRGKMGYHESTELYPDNPKTFGKWANTPIRFPKMPDECKVPRYSNVEGKSYINILGVRFKKIPKFDDPDIIGYKITRSDRKGGNGTVIARGLMTNMRGYNDPQLKQDILYSNYPVNNLGKDNYLSSTQTVFKNNNETNFTPLTTYYKDRFSFYSPHTLFEPRYSLGNEIKIEAEEIAVVNGKFEVVYNHPKLKLLNQFAFWAALTIGAIETYFEEQGLKNKVVATTNGSMSGTAGLKIIATGTAAFTTDPITSNVNFDVDGIGPGGVKQKASTTANSASSALALTGQGVVDSLKDLVKLISTGNFSELATYVKIVKDILKFIASAAATAILIGVSVMRYADEVLNVINDFTGNTDYVYQYNAHAIFNKSICLPAGNKRRRLVTPALYIPSDVASVDDKVFNNYFREKTVYLQLNKPVSDPKTKDTTNNTMSGFGACTTKVAQSVGSAFYATNKAINPNQYGRLGSANPVSIHSCTLPFDKTELTTSPILYGGDCVITRFQFQRRMQFFNQNLATANTQFPQGLEYDYRMYRNIAYPRFWLDSSKYDFSNLLSTKIVNFSQFTRTTTAKHNLDCKQSNDGKTLSRIDDAYMYLSNNTVMDFFVESDYNLSYREKTKEPFYSNTNTNLSNIFRSDRLLVPEEFNISRVYSDLYTTEIFAPFQREDFDPADPIPVAQPNSVIYSLPSFNLQNVDNWQYFLPANFFSFRESDFGKLTAIHKLDQDRIIFLFSKSSPFISMGRDFLELEGSGRKVTIGDGGLFAQDPREIMPTDNNYAACNSKYAFSNTHMGRYYPSESQGRIIEYTDNLNDISRYGMSYWCKNYMPVKFYEYFPDYPELENPIAGVGYLTAFDSFNETIYLTKRDFSPKREFITDILYDKISDTFTYKGRIISLRDPRYFNDISWTLSYSPLDKAFVSWHDWHPDWTIQTDNHFMSVKDSGVWKHNEGYDSYCNFYGIDYPFEIEYLSNSGQMIETVRSIEYQLEVYHYKNGGRNRFHSLNQNFDRLIVHNTEQVSPLLAMTHGNPNPEENLSYPKKSSTNPVSWDIPFFKEENKYRANMFWDTTRDRGEFTSAEYHLLATDESGYKSVINPTAIDINKPEEQRKKFRHYWNKFRLTKTVSGNNKFITKLLNIKKLISPR